MLSFKPLSAVPISTAYTIASSTIKVPVEILATIRTIVEQIDMPVEILATIVEQIDMPVEILMGKTQAGVQKWVLSSRGKQWVLSNRGKQWILSSRDKQWVLSSREKQWILDSRTSKWIIK